MCPLRLPFSQTSPSQSQQCNCQRGQSSVERNRFHRTRQRFQLPPNVVDYIIQRQFQPCRRFTVNPEYGTRLLLKHDLLEENEIPLHCANKVFCSQWLSDNLIIFGTKCNKLLVLNLRTKQIAQIPTLDSSCDKETPETSCGIYSIAINPSRTLLATGARNSNAIALYSLPTLDPVCVGENAHHDRIFDITWLDDEFLISGSRDTTIALWRIHEKNRSATAGELPRHYFTQPLAVKVCKQAHKVRAVNYNTKNQEFVALSLDANLHLWDANTFKQKFSHKLPRCQENVCLALKEDCSLYAVGSKSYLTLHDPCSLALVRRVTIRNSSCCIRSTSFQGNILTVGTGIGIIMFYDIRACNFLERQLNPMDDAPFDHQYTQFRRQPIILEVNEGWVYPEETFHRLLQGWNYRPAIYTHCYDKSGTKLFAAGGPLPESICGNYAGLWQ